ncbi:hypothetical protein EV368DRAFT_69859 [Lentinula lateritia]|nr:hypothetical protein EV368DRAFT_69859 [Lentinula lateritia]
MSSHNYIRVKQFSSFEVCEGVSGSTYADHHQDILNKFLSNSSLQLEQTPYDEHLSQTTRHTKRLTSTQSSQSLRTELEIQYSAASLALAFVPRKALPIAKEITSTTTSLQLVVKRPKKLTIMNGFVQTKSDLFKSEDYELLKEGYEVLEMKELQSKVMYRKGNHHVYTGFIPLLVVYSTDSPTHSKFNTIRSVSGPPISFGIPRVKLS